jgi:hypothetical protein
MRPGCWVEPARCAPAARRLKDADLRKQLGEAGRKRVAEHFGVDRLVDGTLEAYRKFSSS